MHAARGVENHPRWGLGSVALYRSCSSGASATGTPCPIVNSGVEIGDTDCRDTSQQGIRRIGRVNRTDD
jgi:hypothetical protein